MRTVQLLIVALAMSSAVAAHARADALSDTAEANLQKKFQGISVSQFLANCDQNPRSCAADFLYVSATDGLIASSPDHHNAPVDYCMPDFPDSQSADTIKTYVGMVNDTAVAWLRRNQAVVSADVPTAMRQAMRAVWPAPCSSH